MPQNKFIVLLPILALLLTFGLLQLPAIWQLPAMLLLFIIFLGIVVRRPIMTGARTLWQHWQGASPIPSDVIFKVSRWQILTEIIFLGAAALFFTQDLWRSDDTLRLPGGEMEWLTGYVQVAHQALVEHGDIPLWNPYYRNGEPLIDNAFSFLLNPFSAIPGLVFDVTQGIKYSVVFYAFFAAWGGWFLAYVLKLSFPARLLLGLMLLGKGNMSGMFLTGFYQLAVQQAYFAWIIAGTIQVIKTRDRWAIILTGAMMALMFMAGNVWYILPMIMNVFVVAVAYSLPFWHDRQTVWHAWRRLMMAGLVTVTLSAVYTLPVVANYDHIGDHDDEVEAGWEVIFRWRVPALYFTPDIQQALSGMVIYMPAENNVMPAYPQFYYSAVVPAWFAVLIFVFIPPLYPFLHSPTSRFDFRRLWFAGGFLVILMTLWGMGGTALFEGLYAHIAVLRGWRFVGRALAVASFWIAILVALRVDALWRGISSFMLSRFARRVLISACLGVCVAAGVHLNQASWFLPYQKQVIRYNEPYLNEEETKIPGCLYELRQRYPDTELSVWVNSYFQIEPFIRQRIRMANIRADFLPLPDPYTIGDPLMDLWRNLPEYAIPVDAPQYQFLQEMGYEPFGEIQSDYRHCYYHYPMLGMPYIFAIPAEIFSQYGRWEDLRPFAVPVIADENKMDTIAALVQARDTDQVLIIKETAYPGWQVTINGAPANLEITGGFISVRLPADHPSTLYQVIFAYRPPLLYFGGMITIFAVIVCASYLLRVDEFLKRK